MIFMKNELLRHSLSTINYRFDIAVNGLDNGFTGFLAGNDVKSPDELLAHMIYLTKCKSINIIEDKSLKEPTLNNTFLEKIDIFKSSIVTLDKILVINDIDINTKKTLVQGPISDVFTHIGQLLTLRRLYGYPANSGNYATAKLKIGLI